MCGRNHPFSFNVSLPSCLFQLLEYSIALTLICLFFWRCADFGILPLKETNNFSMYPLLELVHGALWRTWLHKSIWKRSINIIVENTRMLCRPEDGKPSKNPSTHSSYTCGQSKVFNHRVLAYCNDYIFVNFVKVTIFLSTSAIISYLAQFFNWWYQTWTDNLGISSLTLSCDTLDFKEKRVKRSVAAFYRK